MYSVLYIHCNDLPSTLNVRKEQSLTYTQTNQVLKWIHLELKKYIQDWAKVGLQL